STPRPPPTSPRFPYTTLFRSLLWLVVFVLMLPALGIVLVKPCVVGTTSRASSENVWSIGYSIYYTLVNIGGAAGPYLASWVHRRSEEHTSELQSRGPLVCRLL